MPLLLVLICGATIQEQAFPAAQFRTASRTAFSLVRSRREDPTPDPRGGARTRVVPHAGARAGGGDSGVVRHAKGRPAAAVPGLARRQALPRRGDVRRLLGLRDGAPRRRGGG